MSPTPPTTHLMLSLLTHESAAPAQPSIAKMLARPESPGEIEALPLVALKDEAKPRRDAAGQRPVLDCGERQSRLRIQDLRVQMPPLPDNNREPSVPSDLYWIDYPKKPRLAIMARPRAGDWLEDEVAHWRAEGVGLVVSLLEPTEARELGLEAEAEACHAQGIEFLNFPIPDRGVAEDRGRAEALARRISESGRDVAIHCRAGIGRSASIAALTLVLNGMSTDDAFARIGAARGLSVPDTDVQRTWVEGSSVRRGFTAP